MNKVSLEINFEIEPLPLLILSNTDAKLSDEDFKFFKVNSRSLELIVLENEERLIINPQKGPRLEVFQPPKKSEVLSVDDLIKRDLESTGASFAEVEAAVEASKLSGGLMSIEDWIEQKIADKGYIQAQEHREEFILATGAGATKFNKWMKKAGLYFNKQTGRWTRWEDR